MARAQEAGLPKTSSGGSSPLREQLLRAVQVGEDAFEQPARWTRPASSVAPLVGGDAGAGSGRAATGRAMRAGSP